MGLLHPGVCGCKLVSVDVMAGTVIYYSNNYQGARYPVLQDKGGISSPAESAAAAFSGLLASDCWYDVISAGTFFI